MLPEAFKLLANLAGDPHNGYLVLDCETTGFSLQDDLLLQVGLAGVSKGVVTSREEITLNWFEQPEVEAVWLQQKLGRLRRAFEKRGAVWRLTEAQVRAGVAPSVGLRRLAALLQQARSRKWFFVGHNILQFDGFRIQQALQEWLSFCWRFAKPELVDTLALVKADQLRLAPYVGETFYDYSRRCLNTASRVRGSLSDFCVAHYGLGPAASDLLEASHTALSDALVTQLLFTKLQELAHGARVEAPFS